MSNPLTQKIPLKNENNDKWKDFVKSFSKNSVLVLDKNHCFCQLCSSKFVCSTAFLLTRHIENQTHLKNLKQSKLKQIPLLFNKLENHDNNKIKPNVLGSQSFSDKSLEEKSDILDPKSLVEAETKMIEDKNLEININENNTNLIKILEKSIIEIRETIINNPFDPKNYFLQLIDINAMQYLNNTSNFEVSYLFKLADTTQNLFPYIKSEFFEKKHKKLSPFIKKLKNQELQMYFIKYMKLFGGSTPSYERKFQQLFIWLDSKSFDLNRENIIKFLCNSDFSHSTYNKWSIIINKYFLSANNLPKIKLKKYVSSLKNFTITKKQRETILLSFEQGPIELYLIFRIFSEVAPRISEVCLLLKCHLKKIKSTFLTIPICKTKERTVSISNDLYNELMNIQSEDFLFSFRRENTLRDLLRKELIKRSLPKITPHQWRYTKVFELHKNGESLVDIQVFMGHASITTTRKYLKEETQYDKEKRDYISTII